MVHGCQTEAGLLGHIGHLLRDYARADGRAMGRASALVTRAVVRNTEVVHTHYRLVHAAVRGTLVGRVATNISIKGIGADEVWRWGN